jgi:hypothetical protein
LVQRVREHEGALLWLLLEESLRAGRVLCSRRSRPRCCCCCSLALAAACQKRHLLRLEPAATPGVVRVTWSSRQRLLLTLYVRCPGHSQRRWRDQQQHECVVHRPTTLCWLAHGRGKRRMRRRLQQRVRQSQHRQKTRDGQRSPRTAVGWPLGPCCSPGWRNFFRVDFWVSRGEEIFLLVSQPCHHTHRTTPTPPPSTKPGSSRRQDVPVRGGCLAEGLVPCKPSWKGQKADCGAVRSTKPQRTRTEPLCVSSLITASLLQVNVLIMNRLFGRAGFVAIQRERVCHCV